MSLKTHQNQGFAEITTFDKQTIYLTEPEYHLFQRIIQNPEAKFIAFDDGTLALSDVRRVEIMPQIADESHRLEAKAEPRELTDQEREYNRRRIADMKREFGLAKEES